MKPHLNFFFHESWITSFRTNDYTVVLELDDVDTGREAYHVSITCDIVKKIETDATPISSELMKLKNDSVLTLNLSDKRIELIAEWLDFEKHSTTINFYYIDCENIKIDAYPMTQLST